jgi:holo-[acyl-carrier protein] synthase
MQLPERDQREIARAESGLKHPAIFENTLAGIPFGKAQIADALTGSKNALAACARAEPVHQPGERLERGEFQDLEAARRIERPRFLDFGPRPGSRQSSAARAAERGSFDGDRHVISIIAKGDLPPAWQIAVHEKSEKCAATARGHRDFMIIGMGIDMEQVKRVRAAIERQGERFLKRVYTEKERAYCEQFRDKYERYAARFAVKEAAMKALGTGWSRGVRWVDIEVVRFPGVRPKLELKGQARKIADRLGVKNIAISITHTPEQAWAQVIFEA